MINSMAYLMVESADLGNSVAVAVPVFIFAVPLVLFQDFSLKL